ncbi:phosphodiester glycosidase family protein [Paenibacillus eucommiae]|uniref:Exopolysaccharide biosynthesis protein n=1 Tax=Paenibacillus eucommiae TaxID=1355755 RepID=A0ABS4ITP0_9BACL|nr:phosphodiester glycosidase family protein [Paenibacillus eucommiae]MBP1990883.1 exopolysaccharide biosynthesis protein [Paenibacillus eucommiae]
MMLRMLHKFKVRRQAPANKMTGIWLLCCILGLASGVPAAHAAAQTAPSVQQQSKTISYNGQAYTVKWITVDLEDPFLRIKPVTAKAGIGHVEAFDSMMKNNQAVAGVNGAFFDAYVSDDSARYPNGLMINSGNIVHSGVNQAFSVLPDKTAIIQQIKTALKVRVDHNGSVYTFEPWAVNKYYGAAQTDQVVWYTREFGQKIDFPNTTKIVIRDGFITAITQSAVSIPEDGQVCMVGNSSNNSTHLLPHLHVGDKVTFEPSLLNTATNAVTKLPQIDAAVGAGPLLLKNGVVDIDYKRDGFTDAKIVTNANARSFIGVDKTKRLVMGTMSAATMNNMAQVLLKLGLTDAMNLDGGASSALYYNGTVLTKPGRLLSNAFIVERMSQAQIQLVVNGSLVNEFRGYLLSETTMVPFRGILERIGADFKWDGAARTLSLKYGNQALLLRPDSKVLEVNGETKMLDIAPTIKDGHIYLPLRAVIETLGGQVSWDARLYRASLTFPSSAN